MAAILRTLHATQGASHAPGNNSSHKYTSHNLDQNTVSSAPSWMFHPTVLFISLSKISPRYEELPDSFYTELERQAEEAVRDAIQSETKYENSHAL